MTSNSNYYNEFLSTSINGAFRNRDFDTNNPANAYFQRNVEIGGILSCQTIAVDNINPNPPSVVNISANTTINTALPYNTVFYIQGPDPRQVTLPISQYDGDTYYFYNNVQGSILLGALIFENSDGQLVETTTQILNLYDRIKLTWMATLGKWMCFIYSGNITRALQLISNLSTTKANIADVVDLTSSQTIQGRKTFSASTLGTSDLDTRISNVEIGINSKASNQAVVHNTGDETIAGIKTFSSAPVFPNGSIPSLALANTYALDSNTLHKDSNETITGLKTFGIAPVMSGGRITSGTIPAAALAQTYALDSAAVHNTGTETIAGIKTFSSPPVMSGASITNATIPNASLQNSAIRSGYVDATSSIQNQLDVLSSKTSNISQSGNVTTVGNKVVIDGGNAGSVQLGDNTNDIVSILAGSITGNPNFNGDAVFAGSVAFNPGTGKTITGLTKSTVGLSSVDNTSDLAKPISNAQQAALDLKAPINNPTFTGTVAGITKAMVGLGSVDNTADLAKPISTAQQTALNLKADDAVVVKTSGDQIIFGIKGFDVAPIMSGGSILNASIPNSALQNASIRAGYVDATSSIQSQLSSAQDNITTLFARTNAISSDGNVTTVGNKVIIDGGNAGSVQIGTSLTDTLTVLAGNVTGITKSMVGLGSVDNTTDANKPISTATQAALDLKAKDNTVVHNTGAETIAGVKTFSSPPVMSGASITNATIPAAALAQTYALDSAVMHTTGNETVAGVKIFSSGIRELQTITEKYSTINVASNILAVDWSANPSVIYTSPSSDAHFTLNLTNVPTNTTQSISVTLFITTTTYKRFATAFSVNGTSVSSSSIFCTSNSGWATFISSAVPSGVTRICQQVIIGMTNSTVSFIIANPMFLY
jgi:hypothetical protein